MAPTTPSPTGEPARRHAGGVPEQRALWASDMNRAAFQSADLFAAILAWGGIGWLLDRWLGTDPWLLVTGFMIGNALGLYMAWVRSSADGAPKSASAEPNNAQEGVGSARQ